MGIILTSLQCGGTHALIGLLKGLGLKLRGRHRHGLWYLDSGRPKRKINGTPIKQGLKLSIAPGEFATGHSGPFPTDLRVICNLRDPRNIMLCHWRRRYSCFPSFGEWLTKPLVKNKASTIPCHWEWKGDNVLRVWYEDILEESTQRQVADFCGVIWKRTDFYGHGKKWSGRPADWTKQFDATCVTEWDQFWRHATGESWEKWWGQNRRGHGKFIEMSSTESINKTRGERNGEG